MEIEVDFEVEFGILHKKVVGQVSDLSYYHAIKEDVGKVMQTLSKESQEWAEGIISNLSRAITEMNNTLTQSIDGIAIPQTSETVERLYKMTRDFWYDAVSAAKVKEEYTKNYEEVKR